MMAINSLKKYYNPFKEQSIAPLVIFRIIFGALLFFGTLRFLLKGWVEQLYISPSFHFGYYGFEWVKPLENELMYLPFLLLLLCSINIVLGLFYRISSIVAFLSFTYIELIDKSYYLNHYYFVSLILFLLMILPANRYFSMDVSVRNTTNTNTVPAWTIDIIKFQLAIVYIFAGIAKLNFDWLFNFQPLAIWLQAHRDLPIVGPLMKTTFIAAAFSWFGCIYDLLIVFFLINKKTRRYAYFFVIVFHIVTWALFPIGVFPWVMIFSTLIFFSPEFHQNMIDKLMRKIKYTTPKFTAKNDLKKSKIIGCFLAFYLIIQLTVPFRYTLYDGNLFWNEEGFRFSWRVMLMHKEGKSFFYIKDKKTNGEIEIDNSNYLTKAQEDQMATQPDMILQYAHYLYDIYSDTVLIFAPQKVHLKDPSIHAEIYVSLNGRKSQKFVSKEHDLTSFAYNLQHRNWIEPYQQ